MARATATRRASGFRLGQTLARLLFPVASCIARCRIGAFIHRPFFFSGLERPAVGSDSNDASYRDWDLTGVSVLRFAARGPRLPTTPGGTQPWHMVLCARPGASVHKKTGF